MSLARQHDAPHDSCPRPGGRDRPTGFDFTLHMRRLCADMVARLDRLRHIEFPLILRQAFIDVE